MEYENDFSFARVHMAPDEYILWKGKPVEGNHFSSDDLYHCFSGIFLLAFSIFWEYTAFSGGAPFFFLIFGGFFVCMGLYQAIGRFFHAAYLRKRTYYVITNRKIIRMRNYKVDMLSASAMPPAYSFANKDGSGTIRFGSPTSFYKNGRGKTVTTIGPNSPFFTLENIPNLVQVQHAIDSMEK